MSHFISWLMATPIVHVIVILLLYVAAVCLVFVPKLRRKKVAKEAGKEAHYSALANTADMKIALVCCAELAQDLATKLAIEKRNSTYWYDKYLALVSETANARPPCTCGGACKHGKPEEIRNIARISPVTPMPEELEEVEP